jgi:ribosome-associated heat shock protein Hsp15
VVSAADEAREECPEGPGTQRLDKWLWFARVAKSRTSAAQLVHDGKVRVNRVRVGKSSHSVRPGDVLTIAARGQVHVLRILAVGLRRGPPAAARSLYDALEQPGDKSRPTDGRAETRPARPARGRRRAVD